MTIVMARLLAESSKRVLVEPYGTYEDYYDTPDEEMHTWIDKTKISTINDEYVDGDQWLTYLKICLRVNLKWRLSVIGNPCSSRIGLSGIDSGLQVEQSYDRREMAGS
jgi:hypothetical protein